MRIVVDSRERSLFEELKYTPPKSLRDYTSEASSRKCGIYLDGDEAAAVPQEADEPEPLVAAAEAAAVVCKHASHTLEKKRLVIGDVALRASTTDPDSDVKADADADADTILFERKTLNDLASSIRDGRYKEQSFRMNEYCELSNHNVIYVIEGDMAKYTDKSVGKCQNTITKKALYSAMFSMMYLKGFSVFRTANIRETADLILYFADKYDAVPQHARKPYYSNKTNLNQLNQAPVVDVEVATGTGTGTGDATTASGGPSYTSVFKHKHKERSSQITPDNIGEIMISSIPFVSSKTAAAIMSEFKTVSHLIETMKKDRSCLNHICTTGPSGNRKISKLCVDNLFKFLI